MKSLDATDKHMSPKNKAKLEIIRPPEVKCGEK